MRLPHTSHTSRSDAQRTPVAAAGGLANDGSGGNRRIVVGVDGSAASIDALRWAVKQALLTGALVEAVTSWDLPGVTGLEFGTVECDWEDNARSTLTTALHEAFGAGAVAVIPRVVRGRAQQVLVDAADGADLLVVGSRGHGAFVGMLTGSVSEHVIAHARCPVVVTRHPDVHAPPPGQSVSPSRRAVGRWVQDDAHFV